MPLYVCFSRFSSTQTQIMNRSRVRGELELLKAEMIDIRSLLSQQIRKQTKTIVWSERRLKKLKRSVVVLGSIRKKVGGTLNRLSRVRNKLSFVTAEPRQYEEPWSSSLGFDTDQVSPESFSEAEFAKQVCFRQLGFLPDKCER